MSISKRSATRPAGLVVGLLLLLAGCGSSGMAGDGAGEADDPAPLPAVSTTPTAPAPRTTGAAVGKAAPGKAAPPAPAVPQYRATLAPPVKEGPVPARFRAGDIDIDLPVVKTGVADDGRMQLPETTREVAWYGFSSRPGATSGTTVLAAHVDTRADGLGPFARLRSLDPGDELEVVDAAGEVHAYTITAVDDVKKSKVAINDLFRLDGDPELKVLTCGGPYKRSTGYRDNIVVSARPR